MAGNNNFNFYIKNRKLFSPFIHSEWVSYEAFIFPGIPGLSFTLTLLNATRNMFNLEDMKAFYLYTDDDNPEEGYLFYRTIGPYVTSS